MDIGFQIKGKIVARDVDYWPESREIEESIKELFALEGLDIDVQVSDVYII